MSIWLGDGLGGLLWFVEREIASRLTEIETRDGCVGVTAERRSYFFETM